MMRQNRSCESVPEYYTLMRETTAEQEQEQVPAPHAFAVNYTNIHFTFYE